MFDRSYGRADDGDAGTDAETEADRRESGRAPTSTRVRRESDSRAGTAGTVLAGAAGLVATSGVASAGGAPATATGLVPLQEAGIPLIGPVSIMVVAIAVAVGLRLVERQAGPMSTWGPEREHPDEGGDEDPTSSPDQATGSTAGRTIESSSARTKDEQAPESVEDTSGVGRGVVQGRHEESKRTRHAIGTFKTASGGGTLMVTSPGFEPDLIFVTGASKGPSSKTGFAEGWSHGIARRTSTGDVEQYAVSVADTGDGTAGGGIREDAALDLTVSADGAGTDAVWGKVTTTVDEGFQFEVSAPSGHERTSTVQYHAVSLPDGADSSVGTFGFGSEPRRGKVDLGIDADFVSLTATTGARPLTRDPDRPVSISHGRVVAGDEYPAQAAIGGAVGPVDESYAAHNDRAVYLLHPREDGPSVAGRTTMRVTTLGETMRLKLEDIYEPAPVAFAVYAAVEMPDGVPAPTTGMVKAPGPKRGARRSIQTDFTPSTVAATATAGAVDDLERTFDRGLSLLGWSHGTMGGTPGGVAGQIPLRAVTSSDEVVRNTMGMWIEDDGFVFAAMEDVEGELPLVLYTAWPGEVEE